jgi:DNA helicase II / ATP-dependent DNA helicase PcrA
VPESTRSYPLETCEKSEWQGLSYPLFPSILLPSTITRMENVLAGLNPAQTKAVTHGTGPLLIVAGAGTGKTTVLTRRYAHLLAAHGLTTDNLLALTFTEKAATEMEDRVLSLLPNGTYDFWISTFHGFCQRVLEERGLEIGIPNRFRLITETDGWLLLKRRLNELPLDHYRPLGNPVKFLSALLRHISRAKDENISPEEYLAFARDAALNGDAETVLGERKRLQELADLFFAYRKILRDEGAMDFGDLILETLRLFRERPRVLQEYRERFPFILVDEFQDTNWAQYELVKLLAGSERNITVVGDDDQAIYKFRGASLANILQFRDDYPDANAVYLTDNYRSHQGILDLAYGFIKRNDPYRLETKLADAGLSKRLISKKDAPATPAASDATPNVGPISVRWYKSLEDEADGVARQIQELKAHDDALTWNDVAILVRSNDGAEPFARALEHHGIPFRFYAQRGLYAKPLIVDMTAVLSLLDDYHEASAVWRALNLPMYAISPADGSAVVFYANRKGISLWAALNEVELCTECSVAGKKKMRELVQQVTSMQETARREPPLKVLQSLLEKTGLLHHILQQSERDKLDQIELLNTFANRVKRYEASTQGPTLKGFLQELRLEIESGEEGPLNVNPQEGPELVKILTVHGSKGLEFRHVFMVSMVDQRFPTRERSDAIPLPDGLVKERLPEGDAHMQEERRLFYVAATRAKETLTFTGADQYGGTRKKKPSAFLEEAGLAVPPLAARLGSDLLSLQQAPPADVATLEMAEIYPLKRRFSFTQLAAFRKCPLQYKLAHVYRIPIFGSFQKSFGQSVHLALQNILQRHEERGRVQQGDLFGAQAADAGGEASVGGFRVTKEEAEQIFTEQWIDQWYPDRAKHDEYWKAGLQAVRAFHAACAEMPPAATLIEAPFDWRLSAERSLKGKIDRVDELPDGSVAVWDYKTGDAKTADDLAAEDKEQLRIYQLALEDKGMRVSKLGYVYVRTMDVAEVEPLAGEDKLEFRDKLIERMDAILASRFPATPSPFVCRYCDFRHICEFRKL